MAATASFSSLGELIKCVADQIPAGAFRARDLLSLCLVSRKFNAAVTPILYQEISANLWSMDESLRPLARSQHLLHTKTLVLGTGARWQDEAEEIQPERDKLVQQMLRQTPLLESFSWKDALLAIETLKTLQRCCPRLKSLQIEFKRDMDRKLGFGRFSRPPPSSAAQEAQDRLQAIYRGPDISAFQNLQILHLENLCDDIRGLLFQVVKLLKNSASLHSLHLSVYRGNVFGHTFFDRLCDEYGATGASPLKLRSLHFGYRGCPHSLSSLEKLTNLGSLEEVHLNNVSNIHLGDKQKIVFDAFGPEHCPKLRQFTVEEYNLEVHEFLATTDRSWASQLAVSAVRQSHRGHDLAALLRPDPKYPLLPLHFRMTEADLWHDWRLAVSPFGDPDSPTPQPREDDNVSTKQVLESLCRDDNGILQGLSIRLRHNRRSETGFDHLEELLDALPKLTGLTQLSLIRSPGQRMVSREVATQAARRIAAASPRLRYLRVCETYNFRVWRHEGECIELESLEYVFYPSQPSCPDAAHVELFRYSLFRPLSLIEDPEDSTIESADYLHF